MVKEISVFNYNTKHQRSSATVKVQEFCVSFPDQCDRYRCFHSSASWKYFKLFQFQRLHIIILVGKIFFQLIFLKSVQLNNFKTAADLCLCFPNQIVSMADPPHRHILCSHCLQIVVQCMNYGENPKCFCSLRVIWLHCPLVEKSEAENSPVSLLAHLFNLMAENTEGV